jgi:hypothetical protein
MSFRSVLIRNEFKAIRGRRNSTIVYLFVILFIAFLSFGFAKSIFNYQKKLSSDPYSNWINLNFHAGTRDSLRSLHGYASEKQFRERFHLKGAYFYNKGMVPVFTGSQGGSVVHYEARTIDPASGIVKDLLNAGVDATFFPDSIEDVFKFEPNGVIISKRLQEDIGLDKRTMSFIRIKSPAGDLVPVPVLAVVDELPDLSDIVYTNLFYCKTMNSGFYDRENSYYRIFVENMDTSGILSVLSALYTSLGIRDPSTVQTTRLITGNTSVLNWIIEIGTQEKSMPVSAMNQCVAGLDELKGHQAGQYFKLSEDTACDNSAFFHDYLALEFNDLDRIGDFSKYLGEKLLLKLNLEVLYDKENYLYTGNIALGSVMLLMLLSVLSVSIYISGVIRNHLTRIKKNLGNFLAFGVENSTLILIYIQVTSIILICAVVPAFILALACGELFETFLLGKLLILDTEQDYFSLFNSWFALFLLLIIIVTILRTFFSVYTILKHTPGDLVYERDS